MTLLSDFIYLAGCPFSIGESEDVFMNIINKYCNTYLGLKYMFKASDCSVREICTVLQCIMFAISYNIRLMESTWSQCLCPFQLSVTRHIFTKICNTAILFEGPVRRDPGAKPLIKSRLFFVRFIYLCCQS
jgi:hypothetical protein